jgi:hypothetical protein
VRETSQQRPRPGILYLFATPPTLETPTELLDALSACTRARTRVRFVPQPDQLPPLEESAHEKQHLAHDALRERLDLALSLGSRRLHEIGVQVVTGKRRAAYLRRRTSARSITS